MDRSSKQKINKETQVLNDTLDEMDLIDIFKTFHLKAEEYTFFSSAHGIFSRIDHILGHKSNLSKFKKIEIISSIFSNHNAMRLYINYKKETVRNTNVGFPGGLDGKESACNDRDQGSVPGLGRSPGEGNGNPLQ